MKSGTSRNRKHRYRSGLEQLVGILLDRSGLKAEHEKETLKYLVPEQKKRYLVDFTLPDTPDIVLEVKGQFTSQDRKKMLLIRDQYPDRRIIMLFGRANNKLSRKSPTTYADWCDKNEIAWVDLEQFKENPHCVLTIPKPEPKEAQNGTGKRSIKKGTKTRG